MGKDAPKPPDYTAAAEQQGQDSRRNTEAQTWANRPTQITPFGQVTWENTPVYDPTTDQDINRWTQTTTLTPDMQAALNDQQAITRGRSSIARSMLDRAQGEFAPAVDWSQLGPVQQQVGRGDYYSGQAGDAIYGQFAARAEPRFQQQASDLRTQLYNQGLREGDPAFDRAMNNMTMQQNDARQQASYQATIGAGAEGARMQGMDVNAVNTNTQLRQQQIAEEMQRRGFSLNEINAILTGQQVGMPSMPSFNTANRADTTQYLNAAQMQGQAALDSFNAEQQALQGTLSAASSGAALAFSDRRLKRNIMKVRTLRGMAIYIWDWVWGGVGAGVMADEVPAKYVHVVGGYLMVNYGALNG